MLGLKLNHVSKPVPGLLQNSKFTTRKDKNNGNQNINEKQFSFSYTISDYKSVRWIEILGKVPNMPHKNVYYKINISSELQNTVSTWCP